jgi:hypothetical protein
MVTSDMVVIPVCIFIKLFLLETKKMYLITLQVTNETFIEPVMVFVILFVPQL